METPPVATWANGENETFQTSIRNYTRETYILKNPEDEDKVQMSPSEGASSVAEDDARFTSYELKEIDEITVASNCLGTSGGTNWQATGDTAARASFMQNPVRPITSEDKILMVGANVSSESNGSDKTELAGNDDLNNIRSMTSVRALATMSDPAGTRESVEQMFQRLSSPENISVWQMTTRSGGRIGKASVQKMVKRTHSQKSVKKSRGSKFFVAKRKLHVKDSKTTLSPDLRQKYTDRVMETEYRTEIRSISSRQQVSYHPTEGMSSKISSETSTRASPMTVTRVVDTERQGPFSDDVSPNEEPSNISIILYTPHGCLKPKKFKIKFRSLESHKSNTNSTSVADANQTSETTCFTQEISDETKNEWRAEVMSRNQSSGSDVAEDAIGHESKPKSRKRFRKSAAENHRHINEDISSPLHQNQTSPFDSYHETSASIDEAVICSDKNEAQKEDISRNCDYSESQISLDIQSESRSEYQKQDISSDYKHAASALDESFSSRNTCMEVMEHTDSMYDYHLMYCKSCMKYFVKELDFKKHKNFCSAHRRCAKCFKVFETRFQLFRHISQKKHHVKPPNFRVAVSLPKLQKLKAEGKLLFESFQDLDRIRMKRLRKIKEKAVVSGTVCGNSQVSNKKGKTSYPDFTASLKPEISPRELLNSLWSNSVQSGVLDKLLASTFEIPPKKKKTAYVKTHASKADCFEVSSGSEFSFGKTREPRKLSNSETHVKNLTKLPVSSSETYRKNYRSSSDSVTSSSKLDKEHDLLESNSCAAKSNTIKGSSNSRDLPKNLDVQINSDEKNWPKVRRLSNINTNITAINNDIDVETNGVTEQKTSGDKKHYRQCLILCNQCDIYFLHRESYSQHKLHCKPKKNVCFRCGYVFRNIYQLDQHIKTCKHSTPSQAVAYVSQKRLEYLITIGRVSETDIEKDKALASMKKKKGYFKPEKESVLSKPYVTKAELEKSDTSLSKPVDPSDKIADQYVYPSLLGNQRNTEDLPKFPSCENHEDDNLQSAVEDNKDVKSISEDDIYIKVCSMQLKSGYEDARTLNSDCSIKETVNMHSSLGCNLKENLEINSGTIQEKEITSNFIVQKDASQKFVSKKDVHEFVKENITTFKSIQVKDAAPLLDGYENKFMHKKDSPCTLVKIKDVSSISIQEKDVHSKSRDGKDTISKSLHEKTVNCEVVQALEKDPSSKIEQVKYATSKLLQEKEKFTVSLQEKGPTDILVQVKDVCKLGTEKDVSSIMFQEKDLTNKSPEKVSPHKSVLENGDAIRSLQEKDITCKSGPEMSSLGKPERLKAVTVQSSQKNCITSKTQAERECTSKLGREKVDAILAVQETDSNNKHRKEKSSTVKAAQERDITNKLMKKRNSLTNISSLKRKGINKESQSSVSVISKNEHVMKVQHSKAHEKKDRLRTSLENSLMKKLEKERKNYKTVDDILNSVSSLGEPKFKLNKESRRLVDDVCLNVCNGNASGGHDEESIIFKDITDIPVKASKETEAPGIVDKVTLTKTVIEKRGLKETAIKRKASCDRPMPKSRKIARSLALSKISYQKEQKQPSPIQRRSVRLEKLTEECPGCLQTIDVRTAIFNTLTHEFSFWCKKCEWDIIFLNFGLPNDL